MICETLATESLGSPVAAGSSGTLPGACHGLPAPLRMEGDPHALSRALDEIRGER
jgi:hypothetical protein